jgi:hypothetical protein
VLEPPHDFLDRVRRAEAESATGRLPLPDQSEWDIFPYEPDSLRVKAFQDPVFPEPPRSGENGVDCWRCDNGLADGIWHNDRWVLASLGEPLGLPFAAVLSPRVHADLGDLDEAMAAEMGVLTVRIERAVMGLGGIGRVHVNKWGDGGAHLHVFFLARPEGFLQLRGSNLPEWEEMLPRYPEQLARRGRQAVAAALAEQDGVAADVAES